MQSLRFLLAVVLMIAVMVITNILLPPPRPAPSTAAADSAQLASPPAADGPASPADVTAPASDSALPAPGAPVAGSPAAAAAGPAPALIAADTVVITAPRFRYAFSTLGSTLVGAQLLQFVSTAPGRLEGEPVDLVEPGAGSLLDYRLRIGEREIDLRQLEFRPEPAGGLVLEPGQPATLRMVHGDTAAGFGIELEYTFRAESYLIDVRGAVRGAGQQPVQLLIGFGPRLALSEADSSDDERHRAYVVNNPSGEGIQSVRFSSLESERIEEGPFTWVALRSKYFVAGLLQASANSRPFGGVVARPAPQGADLTVTLAPGSDGRFAFRFYAGPQEQAQLQAAAEDFDEVNPFGWKPFRGILQPLGAAITWALYGLHDLFGIGYGWVLILFGVIIRLLLWPLNAKAMRSQMKNMEIQPKMKELQARYKSEPEKLQKEMLRLYKEEGFNPMGGCMPMLVPLPILLTLFFVFQNTIAFRGVEFLWLPDLSRPDPLYILPVLLGASMFALQWFSMRAMTEPNPQAKMMMYFMPVFMTILFLNFASGLNLYYTAMNFASVPQQLQITRERQRYQAQRAQAPAPSKQKT